MTVENPSMSSQIILPKPLDRREREVFKAIADRDKEIAERIEEVDGRIVEVSGGGSDTDAIHDNVAEEFYGIAVKKVLAEDDLILLEDSEASFVKKVTTLRDLQNSFTDGLTIPETVTLPLLIDFESEDIGDDLSETSYIKLCGFESGTVQGLGYQSTDEPDYPVTPAYTFDQFYHVYDFWHGFCIDLGDEAVYPESDTAKIRMEIHCQGHLTEILLGLYDRLTEPKNYIQSYYRSSDAVRKVVKDGSTLETDVWGGSTWSYSPGPAGGSCVYQLELDFTGNQTKHRMFGTQDTNIGRQDSGWKTDATVYIDDISERLRYARFNVQATDPGSDYHHAIYMAWIGTGAHAWPNGRID